MIDATRSMEAAREVAVPALVTYLKSTGWDSRPSRVAGVTIFSKQLAGSEEPIQFILPDSSTASDIRHRIAGALRTLEAVEERPIATIVESVQYSPGAHEELLRLIALDRDDMEIVSQHLQDAVLRVGDIEWLPAKKEVVLTLDRYERETFNETPSSNRRRRTVLRFHQVLSIRSRDVSPANVDGLLSMLSIEVDEAAGLGGTITLRFSGDAALRLEVQCIEAELADLQLQDQSRGSVSKIVADESA